MQAAKTGNILARQPVPSGTGDYYAHLIFAMHDTDVIMKLQVRWSYFWQFTFVYYIASLCRQACNLIGVKQSFFVGKNDAHQ
jgi:hypothetical protein